MSAPKSNYGRWLRKADADLLNIENNFAAAAVPWDTVCFHAQQAAEKVLKAFLVFHGRPAARTHDLVALLAECVTIDASLAPLESDCRALTYYAVSARYPDDLFEPQESDARAMRSAARCVREEILRRLPAPPLLP